MVSRPTSLLLHRNGLIFTAGGYFLNLSSGSVLYWLFFNLPVFHVERQTTRLFLYFLSLSFEVCAHENTGWIFSFPNFLRLRLLSESMVH